MSLVLVIVGLLLLVVGGEFLIRSSVAISFKFNISKLVIGMTVVSFATSVPELIVSINAALTGSPAISINNVIGSNIANVGLVLGVTALINPIGVDKQFYRLNWPAMMLFSLGAFYFLSNDKQLTAIEGVVLLSALIIFLILLIKSSKTKADLSEVDDSLAVISNFKIITWLSIGAVALYFGSEWLVKGAIDLAEVIGVSKAVISVSVIAIGTSIPELAASIVAAAKHEKAISLGNLIGSNIFNIGSVLGITSIIKTIPVTASQILTRDIFWMLAFAVILIPLTLIHKKYVISRYKGFFLVLAYGIFIILLFTS